MNFFKKDYKSIFDQIDLYKILIAVLFITVIAFSPIFFGSEFFTFDDNWYIYENQNVVDFSWDVVGKVFLAPHAGQYSPLGELYNALIYNFFGENATAFKIAALIIHLLNVFLLFVFLEKTFQDKLLIVFILLFFAIHPMQVETVCWMSVTYRNSVFFMFLGYFFYFKYLENNFQKLRLLPVVLCFVIGFLFKEQAILFPVGLLLINIKKFNFKLDKRIVVETVFFGILALFLGLFTISILNELGPSVTGREISIIERIYVLSKTIVDYVYNFVFPFKLSFLYPYPTLKNINFSEIIIATSFVSLGGYLALKNKLFRFGFLWLFGFLSLSLALSFFSVRVNYMADRYVYVAIIGFAIICYYILLEIQKKYLPYNFILGVLLLFSVLFTILSFNRVSVFKNNKDLWTNALEVDSENQYANNSLGFYYRNIKDYDKAHHYYKRAIEIDSNYFLAHNNIGYIYEQKKQYKDALHHFSKAISIYPRYKVARDNIGVLIKKNYQDESLLSDLNDLIILDPNNVNFQEGLITLLFRRKEYKKLISKAIIFLKQNSNNRLLISYLGRSCFYLKKYKQAIPIITSVIPNEKKNKGYYYFIRSVSYYQIGMLKSALEDLQSAQKLSYNVPKSYLDLIIREVKKGKK